MISLIRNWIAMPVLLAGALAIALVAGTYTGQRDGLGDLIKRADTGPNTGLKTAQADQPGVTPPSTVAPQETPGTPASDADISAEQAQRLMKAVDAILQDAAKNRGEAKKLPTENDFIVRPIWTETREDRERKIRDLLDAALGVITEVPVVELQKKIDGLRKNIRELEDRGVRLREKQIIAPKDGVLPGIMTDTIDSLAKEIDDTRKRIEANRAEIARTKGEVREALKKAGVQLSPEQIDLLLDSVLSGDLVRLIAVFNSAKLIDGQLGKLLVTSGESIGAARKYFAMHAALFALLVQAQDAVIAKIDNQYLPKLATIETDIRNARSKTIELMRLDNRDDQKRALESNRESQRLAEEAAKGYRRYLLQQREQIAKARQRATHDLRIADNTFETVEASFQLRNLMRDATASFEAIQKLEAPTFDQIFKNEELRREFESLTRKLDAPTS
jgi:polyhydroxyalkanoate synthesis regulator phasin